MAKTINRLTAKGIDNLTRPGNHHDGLGLYLQVAKTGGKSWLLKYTISGKAREMGLGSQHDVTLEAARKARDAQRALLKGELRVDPVEVRLAQRRQSAVESAKSKTFNECAAAYIKDHKAEWRNAKYPKEWASTLETYAAPTFGTLPVGSVDTGMVMTVLDPIWRTKTETANRVRGRIEVILDWATVHGFRSGDNPARWRGHLDKLLPKPSKVRPVQHRDALPYGDVPAFLEALRKHSGTAVQALEIVIFTAARVSEVVGATWAEFDLKDATWTIPGSRIKSGREHRIPLSTAALKVLQRLHTTKQNEFVFPGQKVGKPLTIAAPMKQLRDMGHEKLTVHGFRSSFRDWCGEQTNFPREIAEAALSHVVKDKTEAAYARGDLFDKRAKLMQAWAQYCTTPKKSADVTPLRKRQ